MATSSSSKEAMTNKVEYHEVVIVGSGFSGLCMAIKLKEAGISDFVILEKANEVGGTWRENSYPGCACDVQSHLYSYSFEPNSNWTRVYSGWQEIQAYILGLYAKHDLRRHVCFEQEVCGASFQEESGLWNVQTKSGQIFQSRFFILGTGPLHVPSIPNIKGLDRFKGEVFHSAQWNHGYDLKGKTVVSIGTGGSAIQYAPEIAPEVKRLYVFQRTPAWVLPRNESAYARWEKQMFQRFPLIRRAYRSFLYWFNESRVLGVWNPKLANMLSSVCLKNLKKSVKDPALVRKLTPDYTVGCKRVLISNRYYPMFNRDNVELVTDGIAEITEHGVMTTDGQHREADAIILGTGFVTDPRQYLKNFSLKGLNGVELTDVWRDWAYAYYGMTLPDFPNLFQMVGPNTGLGHNSVIFMIESQVRYILDAIASSKRRGVRYMALRPSVMTTFNEEIADRLKGTVWASGCQSWYTQETGHNFSIWPGTTFAYRWRTRQINPADYQWVGDAEAVTDLQSAPVASG